VSFWDTLGVVGQYVPGFAGVFDAAKVAASTEDPKAGPDSAIENAKQFGAAFFKDAAAGAGTVLNSDPVRPVMSALAWTGNTASHALSAANSYDQIAREHGQTGFFDLAGFSAQGWENAWNETGDVTFGQSAVGKVNEVVNGQGIDSFNGTGMFGNTADAKAARARYNDLQDGIAGKVASGAVDVLATWYADPTIGVGHVAQAARAGSKIADAAHAEEVFQAGAKGARSASDKAAGLFSTSADETASRLYANVAKSDNMSVTEAAAHFKPILERSGDAGPLVGILGQAGSIADINLQRQVKADVLLAAAGSTSARSRLIESAPEIARAVQRVATPPEAFGIVDKMAQQGYSGQALLDAAQSWASTGNQKELEAYAKQLDDIHARIAAVDGVASRGGIENVGGGALNALKSAHRSAMQEFYYQPGPSSRTIRVVHWATGQRARGVIATDDAVRGHDELLDTMKRSGLFGGDDIKQASQEWWSAPTQEARSSIAQQLPERMLNRLANKYDMSREQLDSLTKQYQGVAQGARTYTTAAMEQARVNNLTRVMIEDPVTGTPTSIDRALFETHIQNNVGIPDVDVLERIVKHHTGNESVGDMVANKIGQPVLNSLEGMNDVWRTLTLARPGYITRTQLDTQARSIAMMGATRVVANAMKGLGHAIGDKLNPDEIHTLSATAEDLARKADLGDEAASLRRQAAILDGDKAQRLLDRATALEQEAAQPSVHIAQKARIPTTDRTLNIGGQQITTRSAADEADLAGITAATHTGDASVSDAILRTAGRFRAKLTERGGDWVTTMPDDQRWSAAWKRSTDSIVRSAGGRKILDALDEPTGDMVRRLRTDPDIKATWREVRDQNPSFPDWLDRAISQVQWTAPTREVRDVLRSGKNLTEQDAEQLFRPVSDEAGQFSHLPDRMPVHGPAMDVIDPVQSGIQNVYGWIRHVVGVMSDQPDTVLGRLPFYDDRYFQHFQDLASREIARNGEMSIQAQAGIEKIARHRAIQDAKQFMYDTARFTGAHDRVARMGLSFVGAWEDSMRAWSRMIYDDPATLGKLVKVWYAPNRMGMVVDENGNPVRPGQKSRESWITVPVDWIPGVDFKDFRFRKDSFNSVFQGTVPWMPGFAPMVQVPAGQIAVRTFPEVADPNSAVGANPIAQSLFSGGLPKGSGVGDIAGAVTPGWIKRLVDIKNGDNAQFNDAYAMALNTELMKAREAGKDTSSKSVIDAADQVARKTARSMMFMEFASNFGLGLSGEGATTADFYRQRYREISKNADVLYAQGSSPAQEMARQHPEAAGLDWTFSKNETGIDASLKVENRVRKYGRDIQKNPEYGWFYIGSDNVGGEFSAASYDAQFAREGAPGSGQSWRSKENTAQIRSQTAASLGWDQYYKVKTMVDDELKARGLHSTSQKGAEDLANAFKAFKDTLSAQNPDWAKDYNSFNPAKVQQFLSQVAIPALSDSRLKNRSDIKTMAQYLILRQQAESEAESQGFSLTSNKAAYLRAALNAAGQEFAQQNIGFSQMWQRMFQREVDTAEKDNWIASTEAAPVNGVNY
jgi:hypothetical protein